MDKEYKAVELTDEELAKVVGGARGTDSCPNHYTVCTVDCLNANCGFLVQVVQNDSYGHRCSILVPGSFTSYVPVIECKYEGEEVQTKF